MQKKFEYDICNNRTIITSDFTVTIISRYVSPCVCLEGHTSQLNIPA